MSQIISTTKESTDAALPLNYARTLSWLSLVIILLTSLGLSIFIANSVRDTLLTRQEEFAKQLMQNLNSQIFRRFVLPTMFARGHINPMESTQYDQLDKIVHSVIQGLPVEKLRLYDFAHRLAYSTQKSEMGSNDFVPENIKEILDGSPITSQIISSIPQWQAPFRVPLNKGTFVLKVLSPLKGELIEYEKEPIMGALELTQDITNVYEQVIAFQGILVGMCLLSSAVLFTLLLILIRRSERVLAERMNKNRQLENKLHDNEKLASMGRVVASIAHEIRNPLGIIRSSAELLQKRTDKTDSGTSRILNAIYDESVRLSQTVNDFLDYAKPRQPKTDIIDIHFIFTQVFAFLEGEFNRNQITIDHNLEKGLLVHGDKDLLYRAFYNILVNGQQAMNGPGIIKILVDKTIEKNQLYWQLDFIDSGSGFNDDILNHVLDPFFTTKDDGTGLGLPIVNSIVSSHNGHIELTNSPDSGACVRVFLPAIIEDEAKNE